MEIVLTHVGGPHYDETVRLRQRVLRDPLGLVLDPTDDVKRVFLVALERGRAVGTVALEGHRLKAMAVDDRGRGIGRFLVERLEEEARLRGVSRIELNARITACAFYEKLGFQLTGEYEEAEATTGSMSSGKR